nr:hypothetical transcript [Hymenolepis microstoma]
MSRNQVNGPVGLEMPPLKRLPRFAVSPYIKRKDKYSARRVCSQPDFSQDVKMRKSTESLHRSTNFSRKLETPLKDPFLNTLETPGIRCDPTFSPRFPSRERYDLGSSGTLHETPSLPVPPSIKTLHAPKANQVYAVPLARTFDSTKIDFLMTTLKEKLINLRSLTDVIANDVDYTSKLLREINILAGRS